MVEKETAQVKAERERLVPVRMVNEYVYCPRLAYLEWVNAEWAESADTVEGKHKHRRVDAEPRHAVKERSAEAGELLETRALELSSDRLGIVARLDVMESRGKTAAPVDYKQGKRPHVSRGAYDPERVQLCAQGLLLEEQGFHCPEGVIYYCDSRERVRVPFDEELRGLTMSAIDGIREAASQANPPPPLVDSPKCPRCSLVGICLPDEVNRLTGVGREVRPLAVDQEEALPLHIQSFKAKVTKRDETLEVVVNDGPPQRVRIVDVSQLVIMGSAYVSTPCLQELMRRGIPVSWYSYGGWFYGHSIGTGHKNVELRIAQYRKAFDPLESLEVARTVVAAKIENCRTLVRRNWKGSAKPSEVLRRLKQLRKDAVESISTARLLGIEGAAGACYFGSFSGMLKDCAQASEFRFERRNRRPPTDPINALLSFAYAMLVREWTAVLSAVGLDAYLGFYHQPRYGRPALALDMMEPFRPLVADSAVLSAVNTGEIQASDFVVTPDAASLTDGGRKAFVGAFERRLSQEVTHPVFGYKVSYRRLFELQARLLGRYLTGEFEDPPVFTTR